MVKNCLIISLILVFFSACFFLDKSSLTDSQVTNYIKAYNAIKKVAPDMAKNMDGKNTNGLDEFKKFEKVIVQNGFKDFTEFVFTTQKIMVAFSMLQSDVYMDKMKELEGTGMDSFKDLMDNPNISSTDMEEIKKSLEKNKADFEKNKKIADGVLNFVSKQTDTKSLEVVKSHFKELEDCFKTY